MDPSNSRGDLLHTGAYRLLPLRFQNVVAGKSEIQPNLVPGDWMHLRIVHSRHEDGAASSARLIPHPVVWNLSAHCLDFVSFLDVQDGNGNNEENKGIEFRAANSSL